MRFAKYLPNSIKDKLLPAYFHFIYREQLSQFWKTKEKPRRFILIGSPEHGNLGDHAIAEAECKFLEEHFPETSIVELSGPCYRTLSTQIHSRIKPTDIILITGGGFLGSLWMIEENMVRDILQSFPNNYVIILPQTIFFEDTINGKQESETSTRVYGNHEHLTLCLREQNSYNYVIDNFDFRNKMKPLLAPDMVLSMSHPQNAVSQSERKGILLCLRKDKESCFADSMKSDITASLQRFNLPISTVDTVVTRAIPLSKRKQELDGIFQTFSQAQLVVTDRLHGMLFAVITGTHCIALNNVSRKVAGVYEWIKELEYVSFVKSLDEIGIEATKLLRMPTQVYNPEFLTEEFEQMIKELRK